MQAERGSRGIFLNEVSVGQVKIKCEGYEGDGGDLSSLVNERTG